MEACSVVSDSFHISMLMIPGAHVKHTFLNVPEPDEKDQKGKHGMSEGVLCLPFCYNPVYNAII